MPVPSIGGITQLGTKYSLPPSWGSGPPGLKVEQILWALYEIGYAPVSHEAKDPNEANELIYTYVESGIPPILIIGYPTNNFHAVTVVGHTYDPCVKALDKTKSDVNSSSIWSPLFLFHDDQIGPYLKLRIGSPRPHMHRPSILIDKCDPLLQSNMEEVIKWYSDASLYFIIAAFPPRYELTPDKAAAKGRVILEIAYRAHKSFLEKQGVKKPAVPIYRTFFIPSNQFRSHFNPQKIVGLSPELAHWYRGSIYPRFIWVTELCDFEHRDLKQPNDLRVIADTIIDPTSPPHSLDFVTLHVPHLFFRMPPSTTDTAKALSSPIAFIRDDRPYQPILRLQSAQAPLVPCI